jgi:SPP1 family predicted phage head-tail adaptor
VQIQTASYGTVTAGNYSAAQTWTNGDEVWASIKRTGANEQSDSNDNTVQRAVVKIRHRTDMTPKMRLTYDGDTYEIESIDDKSGKKEYLFLNTVIT